MAAVAVARTVIAVVVALLLARAAVGAWRHRQLARRVWRSVRARHLLGSLGLLVGVLGTFLGLMTLVPVTGWGLGSLLGLAGNAVFAPIEGALQDVPAVTGVAAPSFPWAQAAGVLGFLALLVVLFPFLAYGEERAFRSGLERAGPGRQLWAALRFGLVHLVMLIPLAAALAIAVAGLGYGIAYRRRYARALATLPPVPTVVARPPTVFAPGVVGQEALVLRADTAGAEAAALLESTTWHATFNTVVAVTVAAGYLLSLRAG